MTTLELIPAQAGFLMSGARYPAYVGAWGTGKSAAMIARAVKHSEEHPRNLGVLFRLEYTDLRDSTVPDFEEYTGMKVDSERSARFPNGSAILFRHMEEARKNNLQNMNLGWFVIEQAEELDTDDVFMNLHGRLRRHGVPRWGGIVANTNGDNWIKRLWKDGDLERVMRREFPGWPGPLAELFEAESEDAAPYLPADTLSSWRALERIKPATWKRLVKNSWDAADTVNVMVRPEWHAAAEKADLALRSPIKRVVAVDVARFGDDSTVLVACETDGRFRRVLAWEEHHGRSVTEVAGLAQVFARRWETETIAVDEIGVGAGVVDILRELGRSVVPVNSSERSSAPDKCSNRRAEIYGCGAGLFERGEVQLPPGWARAREEISWTRYGQVRSNGHFKVEPKEDVKERHGRSPDHADALLMALWAAPQGKVWKGSDKYSLKPRKSAAPGVAALG